MVTVTLIWYAHLLLSLRRTINIKYHQHKTQHSNETRTIPASEHTIKPLCPYTINQQKNKISFGTVVYINYYIKTKSSPTSPSNLPDVKLRQSQKKGPDETFHCNFFLFLSVEAGNGVFPDSQFFSQQHAIQNKSLAVPLHQLIQRNLAKPELLGNSRIVHVRRHSGLCSI